MAKINYDNLYVAFPVYDHEVETEMWEQYETFGTIEHRIIISPKKKLVYSKVVTASMIDLTSTEDIKVVNGDQAICTLSAGASLNMVLLVRNGVGYVSATENKVFCKDVHSRANGFLPIDSIFTPVERCKYEVSKTRHEDNFDCDQLILEVCQ